MTSSRARCALALSGATVVALSPVAAQAASPASSFTIQDDAQQSAEPGDDAEQTSEPEGETEPTETEPTEGEPTEAEPTEDGNEGAEDPEDESEGSGNAQTSEGLDVGEDVAGPVDDPSYWEDELDFIGFVDASCSVQPSDAENPGLFTLSGAAPEGKDWILAILLADISEDEAVFDFFLEPLVGESFGLEGADGELLDLSQVIVCSVDLESSPEIPVDEVSGLVDVNVVDRVNGPVVETDVPVASTDAALGGLAFFGVGAAALTAAAMGARKSAARH